MKILDPSSTVREGEYATAQNTVGVTDKIRNAYNKAIDGSFLTDDQVRGYTATAESLAEVRRINKIEIDAEFDRRAAFSGLPRGAIAGNSTDNIVDEEENKSKSSVIDYANKNPTQKESVRKMVADGKSYIKIKELLGI